MFLRFLKLSHLIWIIGLFLFVSCAKDDGPGYVQVPTPPTLNISIDHEGNSHIGEEPLVYKGKGNLFYVTLPMGADLTKVRVDFDVDEGNSVYLGSQSLGNTATIDLSETVELKVIGSGNAESEYVVLAQVGIPAIDELVYAFKEKHAIPGVSIGMADMGQSRILYESGLGYAETESRTRATASTLYRLASMSKQHTALGIMALVEEGVLSLDDHVFGDGGILTDEFPNTSELANKVTVRHLLENASGWVSDPDPMFTNSFQGQTIEERIEYVLNSPQNEPGEVYSYFNMGFGILGKVIEAKSGTDYESYLRTAVWNPAEIADIHVGGGPEDRLSNEAVYYSQGNANGYANDMEVIKAAGGIIASPNALMNLLFRIDGKDNIPDIISSESRTAMLTPSSASNQYALGWRMGHNLFPNSWYHGGNLAGTATLWVMGEDYSAVILCNSRATPAAFGDDLFYLMRDILAIAAEM